MAKPTSAVDWSSAGINTEPPPAKKSAGWQYGEEPFFDYFNWLFRFLGLWTLWLRDLVFPNQGTATGPPAGGTGASAYGLSFETNGGLFVFRDDGTEHRIAHYTVVPGGYTTFQTGTLVLDEGSINIAGDLTLEGTDHRLNELEITTGVGSTLNSAKMVLTSLSGGLSEFTVDYATFTDSLVIQGDQFYLNNLLFLHNNNGTETYLGLSDPTTTDPVVVTAGAFAASYDVPGSLTSTFGAGNGIRASCIVVSTGTGTTVELADRSYNATGAFRSSTGAYYVTLAEGILTAGTPADPGAFLPSSVHATLVNSQSFFNLYNPGPVPTLIVGEVDTINNRVYVSAHDPTTGAYIDILPGWGFALTVV